MPMDPVLRTFRGNGVRGVPGAPIRRHLNKRRLRLRKRPVGPKQAFNTGFLQVAYSGLLAPLERPPALLRKASKCIPTPLSDRADIMVRQDAGGVALLWEGCLSVRRGMGVAWAQVLL